MERLTVGTHRVIALRKQVPHYYKLGQVFDVSSHTSHAIPLYSPTPPVILWRRQPHTAAEPVNPRTPLCVGFHCRVFPGSMSSPS